MTIELDDADQEVLELIQGFITVTAKQTAFELAEALQASAPFTAEDIALIKDHVSPNGVAYRNGKRDERDKVAEFLEALMATQQGRSLSLFAIAAMVRDQEHWK